MPNISIENRPITLSVAHQAVKLTTGFFTGCRVARYDDPNSNLMISFDKPEGPYVPVKLGKEFSCVDPTGKVDAFFDYVYITNVAGVGFAELELTYNMNVQDPLNVTADQAQLAILQQFIAVGVAATPIPAVALPGRKGIVIVNESLIDIRIGSSTVTAAGAATEGILVRAGGGVWAQQIAENVTIYGISTGLATAAHIMEYA